MAALTIEKEATAFPVTLNEAKDFCRVSSTDDDDLLNILIAAATGSCEIFTNRSFCIKGFKQCLDSFPYYTDTMMSQMAYPPSYYAFPRYSTTLWNYSQMIKLFRPPLVFVDSITFLSADDQQWHDMTPCAAPWYPGTVYATNNKVMDRWGNVQQCKTPGTSNANPPVWNKTVGGDTTEGTDAQGEGTGVVWTNLGPQATQSGTTAGNPFGSFLVDADSEPARVFPGPPGNLWPAVMYVPNSVQIHFRAGYSEDGTKVPAQLKTAILQCVAHWYENREPVVPGSVMELPQHVQALLWSKRVMDMQPTRG